MIEAFRIASTEIRRRQPTQHTLSKSKNMLTIRPINITEAVAFGIKHHRRLDAPSAGHKFAIAVEDDFRRIRGVLIAARPAARATNLVRRSAPRVGPSTVARLRGVGRRRRGPGSTSTRSNREIVGSTANAGKKDQRRQRSVCGSAPA